MGGAGVRKDGSVVCVVGVVGVVGIVGGSGTAAEPACATTRADTADCGAVTRSCVPWSTVAPTGTSVLTNTAPTAAAAPTGAAIQDCQCLSAPRRIGISTRS